MQTNCQDATNYKDPQETNMRLLKPVSRARMAACLPLLLNTSPLCRPLSLHNSSWHVRCHDGAIGTGWD